MVARFWTVAIDDKGAAVINGYPSHRQARLASAATGAELYPQAAASRMIRRVLWRRRDVRSVRIGKIVEGVQCGPSSGS